MKYANLILVIVFFPTSAFTLMAQDLKPLKVLFIGNSYTFIQNTPEIVAQMAQSKGKRLYYETVYPGFRDFEKTWSDGPVVQAIDRVAWDVVVLQYQSMVPVAYPEELFRYGDLLSKSLSNTNTKIVPWLTPALASEEVYRRQVTRGGPLPYEVFEAKFPFRKMQSLLSDAYYTLASQVDGEVSPIGTAWEIVVKQHPEIKLHADDGSHPSPFGGYLNGLVMYATLFNDSPAGMPEALYPYVRPRDIRRGLNELKVTTEERLILESAAKQALQDAKEMSVKYRSDIPAKK